MNVLHAIDTAGPGGAETVYRNLVTGLDSEDTHSIFMLPYKGWLYDELIAAGLHPEIISVKGSYNIRYLLNIIRLIRTNNIDLIHSHLLGSNVYCSLAGLLTNTPVIATFHGFVDFGKRNLFFRLKFMILNKGCKAIVFVSRHLRDFFIEEFNVAPDKSFVVYNGIDTERFKPGKSVSLRVELGFKEDDILVGAIGNIRPAKGYDNLLQVAAIVKEKNKKIKFIIAGQGRGKLFESLQSLRNKMNLQDTVYFLGFREDTVELLHNFDLYLLASTSEGLSISTIEALACGVPVVATKCGGPEEIICSSSCGKLVSKNSAGEMSEAILSMHYGSLQDSVNINFDQIHEKWSIKTMLDSYIDLYRSL